MIRKLFFLSLFLLAFSLQSGVAFGWSNNASPLPEYKGDRTFDGDATDCFRCHQGTYRGSGPHGNYTTTTNYCKACHQVHQAKNTSLLLNNATVITDVCVYCHDLTQSRYAPYGFRNYNSVSDSVYSAHRVQGLNFPNSYVDASGNNISAGPQPALVGNVVPGGSSFDGGLGSFEIAIKGNIAGDTFTCFSCHSVHAIQGTMINRYLSESQEKVSTAGLLAGHEEKIYLTNRLLRNRPNAAAGYVYNYTSAWCLTCHQGRDSGLGSVHNHPVDRNADGYKFFAIMPDEDFIGGRAAAMAAINANGYVVVDDGQNNGTLPDANLTKQPWTNAWYAMIDVDPITTDARPDGSVQFASGGPACQQCHANPRDVESAFSVFEGSENPYRISFPHTSPNRALLVEASDDLCTNCHGLENLP